MKNKEIDTASLPAFKGGWSYETESIRTALINTTYSDDDINVLEFGSGDSTRILYTYLKSFIKNVNYDCFETNIEYVTNIGCNTIMYRHPTDVILPEKIYDLILIDGPMGVDRKYWYEKIKPCCRAGTIILIDDWNHYKEFEEELRKNLDYIIFEENNSKYPLKSFKIVKII